MKTIYIFLLSILFLTGCSEDYKLDESFTLPTELSGPEEVAIDLQSSENIVLTWNGGANDGGVLLYSVLFDKGDGNFSEPIYTSQSDFGATRQLTLTHVILNKIAREAGLKTAETGKVKWTVEASRGGVVRRSQECGEILITRPAEEIPEQLYLLGSATENQGTAPVPFRKESDGIFVIYTKLSSGNIYFTDALEDGVNYTVDSSGRLIEGDEAYNVEAEENVVRLTLNFNAKTISKDIISGVRMIWGATFDVIADMQYVGNGSFKKENVNIKFVDPNDPTTNPPSWLTWVEERYYFISTINGADVCWVRLRLN